MDADRRPAPHATLRWEEGLDVAAIDALVTSLYGALSGDSGPRDWAPLRELFYPGARLVWSNPGGGGEPHDMDLERFLASATRYFEANSFYESEIARKTEVFGNIAHVFSTFEARRAPGDPAPFARGINSIQLLKERGRWWVLGLLWDDEREDLPIPGKYLP